jgi:hypothetical protein
LILLRAHVPIMDYFLLYFRFIAPVNKRDSKRPIPLVLLSRMPTLSSRLLSERQQQQQSAADNEIKEDSLVGKIVRGFSIAFNAVYAPVAVVMISLHWGDALHDRCCRRH